MKRSQRQKEKGILHDNELFSLKIHTAEKCDSVSDVLQQKHSLKLERVSVS